MGLEAIEEIEVITAEFAAEIFGATHAEIRVGSGALANLYGFMALTKPGEAIIAPPGSIGGNVTHHIAGCASLYGLITHPAMVDADGYTVDLAALRTLAHKPNPSSSPSAAASTSSPTLSPKSAPSRMRSARMSCSTPPTSAASSLAKRGLTR